MDGHKKKTVVPSHVIKKKRIEKLKQKRKSHWERAKNQILIATNLLISMHVR